MTRTPYDVLVVGARCAGAATALLMARRGLRVLVAEAGEPGTDTLSSHNLTRGAVLQLDRWGLTDRLMERGTPWIGRTTFHFGETVLPIDLKPVGVAPGIMGTRRQVLDATLAEAAAEAGAEILYRTAFRDVIRDDAGRVAGAILSGPDGTERRVAVPLVVGADGLRSAVARRVGAPLVRQARTALGHIYGYYEGLTSDGNTAYFRRGVSVAGTPTNDSAQVVIASVAPARLRALRAALGDEGALAALAREASPAFADDLADARRTEPIRVFAGAPGQIRRTAGPGWALVGDAGYFRDPVTAHGITDAFRDAELLAEAAAAGRDEALARYESDRDTVTPGIWKVTEYLADYDRPEPELMAGFHDLAQEMRGEQAWMAERFTLRAQAA